MSELDDQDEPTELHEPTELREPPDEEEEIELTASSIVPAFVVTRRVAAIAIAIVFTLGFGIARLVPSSAAAEAAPPVTKIMTRAVPEPAKPAATSTDCASAMLASAPPNIEPSSIEPPSIEQSAPAAHGGTRPKPPAPRTDCSLPYTLDSHGQKHFKVECL